MTSDRSFVHLHNHTSHSVLDGTQKLDEMCQAAAADGQPAVAITDHGTMSGAWKFAKNAAAAGVKPILGIELYLAVTRPDHPGGLHPWGCRHEPGEVHIPSSGFDQEPDGEKAKTVTGKKKRYEHLTVLAESKTGWANLMRISNTAQETFRRKPLADFELLAEHHEGLVFLSGCLGGPVASYLARGENELAAENLSRLVDLAGKDNVFVEVMDHGIEAEQRIVMPGLIELAGRFGLRTVATNDAHFTSPGDAVSHDAWLAVAVKKHLDDPARFRFNGGGYHLRSAKEMRSLFDEANGTAEACDSTLLIAERCSDMAIPEPHLRLPIFDVPDGYVPSPAATNRGYDGSTAHLYDLVVAGAKARYGEPLPAVVKQRLRYEFDVIHDKGLGDYFLIVRDVINWARSHGIRVGPGRGSAAGCAISYCLEIVQVDPIANDLLFERFLNPERVGMPDIDVDFEHAAQGRVLAYLRERWGSDRVARIGTSQYSLSRRSVRDVARVMGMPEVGDDLARAVPIGAGGKPKKFAEIADPNDESGAKFRGLTESSEDHLRVAELATHFEGLVAGNSIHACGTIISDESLVSLVPMRKDRRKDTETPGMWVTEWDGTDCEAFGLLKLDVLALRNLDVITACVEMVEGSSGIDIERYTSDPPTDPTDPMAAKAWRLLADGNTAGVFQLESSGITGLTQSIAPTSLAEMAAVVALYRPGPLSASMDERYVNRKHGTETIDYGIFTAVPAEQNVIASVLAKTFGVPLYQEQIMRLGEVIAGFDAVTKNRLQKAVGKKKRDEMTAVGALFMEGAVSEVTDPETGAVTKIAFREETAATMWEAMKGAADYAFNAAHSFAYGWLAYITAFMKANWPAEYGAALLSVTEKDDKRQGVLRSLRNEGIVVKAPSVNDGSASTSVTTHGVITIGMSEVKGVGEIATRVVAERELNGRFASLHDLASRVTTADGARISAGTITALIESGACDEFGPRCAMLMALRSAQNDADTPILDIEWSPLQRAGRERGRLGVVCSDHPLLALKPYLKQWAAPTVEDDFGRRISEKPMAVHRIAEMSQNTVVLTLGVLASWSERSYSGGQMVRYEIEGSSGSVGGVVWSRTLDQLSSSGVFPKPGDVVAVRGKVKSFAARSSQPDADPTADADSVVAEANNELTAWDVFPVEIPDDLSGWFPEPDLTEIVLPRVWEATAPLPSTQGQLPVGADVRNEITEPATPLPFAPAGGTATTTIETAPLTQTGEHEPMAAPVVSPNRRERFRRVSGLPVAGEVVIVKHQSGVISP